MLLASLNSRFSLSESPAHAGSRNRGALFAFRIPRVSVSRECGVLSEFRIPNFKIISRKCFSAGRREPLLFRHFRKMALGLEKFLKSSTLNNPSVIQNDDFIHVGQSGEAVGDTDDGTALLE